MGNSTREKIITRLADGHCISGEQLGNEFGISRAAIAKHIEAISEMGLDIYRVTGKGYQLASPIDLLSLDKINEYLCDAKIAEIELYGEIDSTNSYLMRKLPFNIKDAQICIAEFQSAGRGRRGRQWISPYGSNLYLSMYRFLDQGMSQAMGLSVVAALSVFDAIENLYQHKVELKWPNDVYLGGKKLAGILIDLEGQPLESCHSVIGIGINLAMPDVSAKQVDQPWSELRSIVGQNIDRNKLVAEIIIQLRKRLQQHQFSGLEEMLDDWHNNDIYYNKPIKIITGDNEVFGISRGINDQGALLMEINGKISPVFGGEVSLRPSV